MTIEKLRAAYQAQPFWPFIIHLADGRHIPVQPDDTANIIDLLLIADLEFKPSPNGSSRRRRD